MGSLGYVGFSQGTAQAFAALSVNAQLNEKVNVLVALAPAISPAGLSNPVVDALMKASLVTRLLPIRTSFLTLLSPILQTDINIPLLWAKSDSVLGCDLANRLLPTHLHLHHRQCSQFPFLLGQSQYYHHPKDGRVHSLILVRIRKVSRALVPDHARVCLSDV